MLLSLKRKSMFLSVAVCLSFETASLSFFTINNLFIYLSLNILNLFFSTDLIQVCFCKWNDILQMTKGKSHMHFSQLPYKAFAPQCV